MVVRSGNRWTHFLRLITPNASKAVLGPCSFMPPSSSPSSVSHDRLPLSRANISAHLRFVMVWFGLVWFGLVFVRSRFGFLKFLHVRQLRPMEWLILNFVRCAMYTLGAGILYSIFKCNHTVYVNSIFDVQLLTLGFTNAFVTIYLG